MINMCCICLDRSSTVQFVPCQHDSFCVQCTVKLFTLSNLPPTLPIKCPLCRSDIDKIVVSPATYLANYPKLVITLWLRILINTNDLSLRTFHDCLSILIYLHQRHQIPSHILHQVGIFLAHHYDDMIWRIQLIRHFR